MQPTKRLGRFTVELASPPSIIGFASVVGKKEGEGPLKNSFDRINNDTTFGEKTWEKSESRMQAETLSAALNKTSLAPGSLDYVFAGDLLNQCIGSSFAVRDMALPFYGLYGACSTMAEGLGLASMLIDGGFANHTTAITSSHFASAERQYRMPLEYGGQRTPTAQWTATAAGCCILSSEGNGPYITHVCTGQIIDLGVKDSNHMGAAMAPAAYETLSALFKETGLAPTDFDLILTGDLASFGAQILRDMFQLDGIDLGPNYHDCGVLLYDAKKQDVHAGGSGCGCSASVLCGHILNGMKDGTWNKVLFAGTGALMSPLSVQQGETIPCICHAVVISNTKKEGA
ncbi:MAG TPA: stage V sporulation protein AD [Clostridiales bacterium]|nr:stage V sporulation protein AD [Clostridiales bacterium]